MFIKDIDCTKDTPLVLGYADQPIYGKGIRIRPRVDGRTALIFGETIYRNYCRWRNMT